MDPIVSCIVDQINFLSATGRGACSHHEGYVQVEEVAFKDYVGEQFFSKSKADLKEAALFTDTEMSILTLVANRFKNLNSRQISDISHKEKGWKDNVNDHNNINYMYGFELQLSL